MNHARAALEVVTSVPNEEPVDALELDFDVVFRRYAPYVAAVAHRLLGRDDEVDDTIQEVFLVAVHGLKTIRDPSSVKAWLARITVRTARRRLRRRRLFQSLGFHDRVGYQHLADAAASPEVRALLERVYRVLDGLPTDQRIAWTLRHVQGERLDQVASLTGCSLATAKRRIAAASQVLQEVFQDD